MKKAIILTSILFAVIFITSQNSFAQGCISLLGVNNCGQQTPNTNTNSNNGKRMVHVKDNRAGEIYRAKQNNQRYLLTVRTYAENGLMCEDRAWVGGNSAIEQNQVVVEIGQIKKVCYNPTQPIYSSQEINALEQQIDSFTNLYYQWEKYAQNCTVYINQNRTNPQLVAYGQSEYAKSQQWMNHYRQSIINFRTAINKVAPASY